MAVADVGLDHLPAIETAWSRKVAVGAPAIAPARREPLGITKEAEATEASDSSSDSSDSPDSSNSKRGGDAAAAQADSPNSAIGAESEARALSKNLTWTAATDVSIMKQTGAIVGAGCSAVFLVSLTPAQACAMVACVILGAVLTGLVSVDGARIAGAVGAALRGTTALAWNSCLATWITWVLPVYLIGMALRSGGAPSLLQGLAAFALTFTIVGLCMSVCLHRYFAHQAFKTSRPFQALLAIMGCHAFQGDPVWWAAKHRRHHKHCDTPLDPHSWKQSGYLYAWVGWTFNPLEHRTDNEYVTKYLQYNELFVIGFVWWLWPLLTCAAVCKAFGFYNMVVYASTPMFTSRIVTLLFNVEYHPPDHESSLNAKLPNGAPKKCLSLDMPRLLADCVGESCHDDHHTHPKRANRPTGSFMPDLPYWLMIKPLLMLGLVWGEASTSAGQTPASNANANADGWTH